MEIEVGKMGKTKTPKDYQTEAFKDRLEQLELIDFRIKSITADIVKKKTQMDLLKYELNHLQHDLDDWKSERNQILCKNINEVYNRNKALNKK